MHDGCVTYSHPMYPQVTEHAGVDEVEVVPRAQLAEAQERAERAEGVIARASAGKRSLIVQLYGDDIERLTDECDTAQERARVAEADAARMRSIIDRPDPHDFMVASEVEARFQIDKWGTGDGFPTAFNGTADHDFVYLIAYLVGKVAATPDGDHAKKLHRITTIAAAAANWHAVRSASPTEGEG
jgi:hypothetical protein